MYLFHDGDNHNHHYLCSIQRVESLFDPFVINLPKTYSKFVFDSMAPLLCNLSVGWEMCFNLLSTRWIQSKCPIWAVFLVYYCLRFFCSKSKCI